MNDEDRDDERIRGILGRSPSVTLPPFDALRRHRAGGSGRRSIAITLATVVVAVAALYAGRELSTLRQQQALPTTGVAAPSATASAAIKVTLPQPIPQPITRTSPAAQVAWIQRYSQDTLPIYVGVDPRGNIAGTIQVTKDDLGRLFRSMDGQLLAMVGDDRVATYSALDGKPLRSYARQPAGRVTDVAFTRDGRWLAVLSAATSSVQVIDLTGGLSQTTPLGHDPNPATPGMTGSFTGPIWSTLTFAPDSKRLYTLVDWGGPLRITAFDVTPTGLVQTATAIDKQGGKSLASCGGPGLAPRVLPDGKTMVAFCNFDGDVWVIDLSSFVTADIRTGQVNPFEQSPIFTPDGQLVYLRGSTGLRVVDVGTRSVLGPVLAPQKVDDPGPFSWLFGQALAGYVASTVPVSPDGTKLYFSNGDGISVLRIPDLRLIAKLAPGLNLAEVWISGDGKTVVATDNGKGVYVIPEGGGQPITVAVPESGSYFVASEHG